MVSAPVISGSCCGTRLPCKCCEAPGFLKLLDCETDIAKVLATRAGPGKSLKLDGMQFESHSIEQRTFLVTLEEGNQPPARGSYVFYGTDVYRLTEKEGPSRSCKWLLSTVRVYFPCMTDATVVRCREADRCEGYPVREVVGTVRVHPYNTRAETTAANDITMIAPSIRLYVLGDPLIDWCWEPDMVIETECGNYLVTGFSNADLIDRAPYLEVTGLAGCCGE